MTPLIKSPDILERLDGALKRFTDRDFSMRVPVDPTDIDVALGDAKVEIVNLRADLEAREADRRDAIEKSAKICDEYAFMSASCVEAAYRIRALAQRQEGEEK